MLLVHELRPALGGRSLSESAATPEALADVLRLVGAQTITRTAASEVIAALVDEGGSAEAVVEARGLAAVRDDASLAPAVDAVLAENADEVDALPRRRDPAAGLLHRTGHAPRRKGRRREGRAGSPSRQARIATGWPHETLDARRCRKGS